MNYPSINEYKEAILFAEDNFEQLKHLRPVLENDGSPVMTSGNFAVVFKMKDEQTGKLHAVKCFLREQEGRAEAYRMIAEELEYVSSTFLTPIKYLDKELFVDTNAGDEKEFPVLLMDWVEGETLDKYIRKHLDDQYELSLLAYQFSRLAMWLMPQPFAHGDLKPDNILVKNDGTLVLVDYDGMYVPAMKGQKARELGSPDFRHPSRTESDFDEHIDDFSLASILLSLKAISLQPSLLEEYGAQDRLLFSANDYRNLSESEALNALRLLMQDAELASLYSLFILAASQNNLSQVSFRLFNLNRPKEPELTDADLDAWAAAIGESMPHNEDNCWPLLTFARQHGKMKVGEFVNKETGELFKSCIFTKSDGTRTFVAFSAKMGELTPKEIVAMKDDLIVVQNEDGNYCLCKRDSKCGTVDFDSSYTQIKQFARKLLLSLGAKDLKELNKKLLFNELTILSAASVLGTSNKKIDSRRAFVEQKIFNDYISIKEVDDFDKWIESNTPGMCLDGSYTNEDTISLEEFEKINGNVKFYRGNINAYPYDDSFWGEFIGKDGKKKVIYVNQGFSFNYNVSELQRNKQVFGIVEEKDNYYGGDDVFYCLKKIKKKHSMLSSYINERLVFYSSTIKEAMSNRQKIKEYSFQLYNAAVNDILFFDDPYLGIDDLLFEDEIVVDSETGISYQYNATSFNNFSMCFWDNLGCLQQKMDDKLLKI